MPQVFPFQAIVYSTEGSGADVSASVAPPYDVLDAADKANLIAGSEHNIVIVDLPHIPPKQLGPAEAYQSAATTLEQWLGEGVLRRSDRPLMFAYRQTFEFQGQTHQRSGMACTIETRPFGAAQGGGILPHEHTFGGPKADRLALMKASRTQLSPIFGLHADEPGTATRVIADVCASRDADQVAVTGDGVRHEVWFIDDEATQAKYVGALEGEDVFIADGHHRYNTALNYLAELEQAGDVAPDHPARRCMIVLVSMSDPGMVIGPTHRVLGGMADYSFSRFAEASEHQLEISPVPGGIKQLEGAMEAAAASHHNVFGLYDFDSHGAYVAVPKEHDPLLARFSDRHESWRALDVAVIQHLIVEDICQPALNRGEAVKWAFPHSIEEVLEIGAGKEKGSGGGGAFAPQLAIIVRPTPLDAVRDVSRAGELMPQKSTFFYPKVATGLFLNPLHQSQAV